MSVHQVRQNVGTTTGGRREVEDHELCFVCVEARNESPAEPLRWGANARVVACYEKSQSHDGYSPHRHRRIARRVRERLVIVIGG